MILVTGGTGFIGRALLRHLVELGYPVRALLRPAKGSPNLPRGVPVDVAVTSLNDERGLRAAMVGVDTIFHLISGEWKGPRIDLLQTDIQGTRAVVQAAEDAGVERLFYVSHLGADRASAYPVLKAKGIAEEFIRRSQMDYTILRSAIVYGIHDRFTTTLARLLGTQPAFFLMPGDGRVVLQPLWVEDLVTCLTWLLEDRETHKRIVDIGGPEYLTFRQVAEMVMQETGLHRRMIGVPPPYLRALTVALESVIPGLPLSVYWLDYMAVNRTTALDTMPRVFNLMPARMSLRLAYLRGRNWRGALFRPAKR
jgi:NADH dehydrogenase